MQLKPLIFGPDPAQALRIKRLLFASNTYLFSTLFVGFAVWKGLAPTHAVLFMALGGLLVSVVFYALIRSGLNRNWRDPGMTIPQMAVGTLMCTYIVYQAHEARGAFLLGYILILLFGIFRLRATPTLFIGAVAVVSYAIVIIAESARGISERHLAAEMLQLIVLAFIYPWFAQLGSHLNQTRANLREANTKLARTLSDYEAALEQIRLQATHDDLTGVYNRRHLVAAMEAESARSQRSGQPYALLVLDIDHFKHINDCHGHSGGDAVLVAFAQVVQQQLRSIDQFGRYGGEEFLVLLPDTGMDAARAVAERVRAAVAVAEWPQLAQPLTVSIGVAVAVPGESHDAVFLRADHAVYRAKDNGRNRVEC